MSVSYGVEMAVLLGATRHASSPASFIVVSAIIMAVGVGLGVRRRQVAAFFVNINGGSDRRQALNRIIFGLGIPLMALMFTVFGLIFEIYGWVKLV